MADYNGYITYENNEYDKKIALKLYKQLRTYKIPSSLKTKVLDYDKSKYYVREENKTDSITEEDKRILDISKTLIIICSRLTLKSKRISQEINYFKMIGKSENILALLIDGEPHESFPIELRTRRIEVINSNGVCEEKDELIEPLAADIRAINIKKAFIMLKEEKLRLLASILECKFDDLKRRHRERKIKKVIWTFASIMFVVFIFGIFSLYQWNYAQTQRNIAIKQKDMSIDVIEKLYLDIPEKFNGIPEANSAVINILYDNLESINKIKNIDYSKFDLDEIKTINKYDNKESVKRKISILRNMGRLEEAFQLIEELNKNYPNFISNQEEYIHIAKQFTLQSKQLNLKNGFYVEEVLKGYSAEEQGVLKGSIIIKVDNTEVKTQDDFFLIVRSKSNYEAMELTLLKLNEKNEFITETKSICLVNCEIGMRLSII